MNYKYLIIGLLISVFGLPATDNLVFAGSKCEREKSNIRKKSKKELSSLCGSVLSKYKTFNSFSNSIDPYNRNKLNPHEKVSWARIIIPFCKKPSVNSSVKGKAWGCKKQKRHIKSKYDSQIKLARYWAIDIKNQLRLKNEQKAWIKAYQKQININKAECGSSRCGTWIKNAVTGTVAINGNSGTKRTCVHPDRSKSWINNMNETEYKKVGKSLDDLPIC